MPRKSTDKSTTTESPIASPDEGNEAEVVAEVQESADGPAVEADPSADFGNGMIRKTWSGMPMWHCTKCGLDTFDETEARTHACEGRVTKPFMKEKIG